MAGEMIGKCITKSFERTKLLLFTPFSIKKWLCLIFIAWLAGSLGSSGNFNLNGNDFRKSSSSALSEEQVSDDTPEEIEKKKDVSQCPLAVRSPGELYKNLTCRLGPGLMTLIGVGLIVILGLIILFSWLSARFKFIWYNAVVSNDASIAEPFARYRREGDSLFLFYLALGAVVLSVVVIIAFWVYSAGSSAGLWSGTQPSLGSIVRVFLVPLVGFAGFILLMLLFVAAVDHFVVSIMALTRCRFQEGWSKFVPLLRAHPGDFALYALVVIGFGVAAFLGLAIAYIATVIVVLIAGAVLFGIPYMLLAVLLGSKPLFILFAVIAGIPFLAAVVLLFFALVLPVAVFFRSFSLYFLSSLKSGFTPLALE